MLDVLTVLACNSSRSASSYEFSDFELGVELTSGTLGSFRRSLIYSSCSSIASTAIGSSSLSLESKFELLLLRSFFSSSFSSSSFFSSSSRYWDYTVKKTLLSSFESCISSRLTESSSEDWLSRSSSSSSFSSSMI